MIIVSQNKEVILNFNNIIAIDIDEKDKRIIEAVIGVDRGGGSFTKIGQYATEERAKEVLEEIIKEYKGTEAFKVCANRVSDKIGEIAIKNGFVYEMPLE